VNISLPLFLRNRRFSLRLRAPIFRLGALAIIALMAAPILGVVGGALFGPGAHQSVSAAALIDYALQTALYAGGSVLLAMLIALPAAWITVMYRFTGDKIVTWALFMPLALPPYVLGYAYSHFFDYFGVSIRGMMGACVVTALAVYPYIYLFARAALKQQSCHIQSAARLMGYSPLVTCRLVLWPLARPAVMVGATLALMETLNDIAIAEHYGVRAIGLAVYDLWLNRGDLYAACRLAVLIMLLVLGLLAIEEQGRKKQRQYASLCDRRFACDATTVLRGFQAHCCTGLLLLPAVTGFALPVTWFAFLTWKTPAHLWRVSFVDGLSGSLWLAVGTAVLLIALAALFVLDKRQNGRGLLMQPLARLAQAGYALPGTVLAQGFFVLALATSSVIGKNLLFGGLGLVIIACSTRFFIIATGALETGMANISPQLDAATRLARKSALSAFFTVHLPILRPAAAIAVLMLFLEGVKELPMTLILRPFDFQTLATVVYQYASDEALELAGPAILAMAAIGGGAVSSLFWLEGRSR
jgi:iron(III) transport system permease protein